MTMATPTNVDATMHRDEEEAAVRPLTPVDAPSAPEPIYQTPDWEIPTNPPPPKRSLRNSMTLLGNAAAAALENVAPTKETSNTNTTNGAVPPGDNWYPPPGARRSSGLPLSITARDRFNTILPAHRKYFGQPRRRFLLFIVLPLLILLFVVLPLAVGLGVGLSRRNSSRGQNLPLPSGNGDDVFTGELTYYDPGLGACGIVSNGGESICSVSHLVFDAAGSNSESGGNSNENPLCGKKIRITREFSEGDDAGGKKRRRGDGGGNSNRSVDVTVVDRCVGCAPTDLDLSLSAFEQLALEEDGRVVGSWAWLD